jgi:hypothetical protein
MQQKEKKILSKAAGAGFLMPVPEVFFDLC